MKTSTINKYESTMMSIDNKLVELEELVFELPIRAAIKTQLMKEIADFSEKTQDAVDLSATDWSIS